jgi:hypothetical protein
MKVIFVLVFSLGAICSCFAVRSVFNFLKLGVGARPSALGGAFVAVGGDVNSMYYNPAGLVKIMESQMTVMYNHWFQGVTQHHLGLASQKNLASL